MRNTLAAIATATLLLFALGNAYASTAPKTDAMKIVVIDVHQIIQQAPQVKKINEALGKKFKPRQEKILAQQKKVQADMNTLKRDASVMSSMKKNALQDKIVTERRDLARMEQDYQQDLSLAQNQAMQQFFMTLKTTVTKLAEKNKYDLVLQKDSAPYASSKVDITKQVLEALA